MFSLVLFGVLSAFVAVAVPLLNHQWKTLKAKNQELQQALHAAKDQQEKLRADLAERQKELQQSIEDPVTNLLGWRIFSDRLEHQLRESARNQFTLGVAFVDINHFKMINDALGPQIGDQVLREVAQRIETCIRQVDSLSRFAKDTFVVLLSQLSKPETAALVAQRILQALGRPFMIEGQEINISSSIGIALYPQDGDEAATLLRNADDALQVAKTKGKQVYQFYQEKLQQQSQRELLLYTGLAREVTVNQFKTMYQPISDVQKKCIHALEATFIWDHEELGAIGFDEILLYADKQRKLNQVTQALLRRACDQFMRWHDLGFSPRYLSIPMKIKQLESSQFVYELSQMLQEMDFPCNQLLISLDENVGPVSFDVLEKSFNMLSYLNIKLCLNHFGCGGLSLRYLKNLKVDYIRLDGSFVDDVVVNDYTKSLVNSLLAMGHSMGIEVIASGVDSEEQKTLLSNLNCPLMQGKAIGRALPEFEVESTYHKETAPAN